MAAAAAAAKVINLKAQQKTRAPWTIKGTETRTLIVNFYGGVEKAKQHFLNIENNVNENIMENYIRRDIEYISKLVTTIDYRDLMLATNFRVLSFLANNNFHTLLTTFYNAVNNIVGYEDHTVANINGGIVPDNHAPTYGRGANSALFNDLKNNGIIHLWTLDRATINTLLTSSHIDTNPLDQVTIGRYWFNHLARGRLTNPGYFADGTPRSDVLYADNVGPNGMSARGVAHPPIMGAGIAPDGQAPLESQIANVPWLAVTAARNALIALNLQNYTGEQLKRLYDITTPANLANPAELHILTPQYEWIREYIYKLRIGTLNAVTKTNNILNGAATVMQKYNQTKVNRKINNVAPAVVQSTLLFFKPITTSIRDIHQLANTYLNDIVNDPNTVNLVTTSILANENIKRQVTNEFNYINEILLLFNTFIGHLPSEDIHVTNGILYRLYEDYDKIYTLYMHNIPKQVVVTDVDGFITAIGIANVASITATFATNQIQMKNKMGNNRSSLIATLNAVNSLSESLNKAKELVPHKLTNYAAAQVKTMPALQQPVGQTSIGTVARRMARRLWYMGYAEPPNVKNMFVKAP